MRRVTLQDLAREAGVGIATASRAMAGSPRCAPATRARVEAVARRLGYVPDPALAALVAHRRSVRQPRPGFNLAILADQDLDSYFRAIVDGCTARATAFGYSCGIVDVRAHPTPQAVARLLRARGVVGLVVLPILHQGFIREFAWQDFCSVGFLQPVFRPSIHLVRDNSLRTTVEAHEKAYSRGCRRVGFVIYSSVYSENSRRQVAGMLLAQHEAPAGAVPIPPLTLGARDSVSPDSTARTFAAWMAKHRPDCVISTAPGGYWELTRQGVRIPEACAFISLWLEPVETRMAGFATNAAMIGSTLIEQLDGILKRNERGLVERPLTTLVDRIWRDGPTLPGRVGT